MTNYLESYNLQVNKIEFCKKDFESKAECIFKTNQISANQEEVNLLERVSFAKEKSYMADESYTAFREETRSAVVLFFKRENLVDNVCLFII